MNFFFRLFGEFMTSLIELLMNNDVYLWKVFFFIIIASNLLPLTLLLGLIVHSVT